jgi:hypothetical protein
MFNRRTNLALAGNVLVLHDVADQTQNHYSESLNNTNKKQ